MAKAHLILPSKSTPVMLPSQGLGPSAYCSSSALCKKALGGVTAQIGLLSSHFSTASPERWERGAGIAVLRPSPALMEM